MWYVINPRETTGYVVRVPFAWLARMATWWLNRGNNPNRWVDYAPHESGICGKGGKPCKRCLWTA
jgi:hypothetical protein